MKQLLVLAMLFAPLASQAIVTPGAKGESSRIVLSDSQIVGTYPMALVPGFSSRITLNGASVWKFAIPGSSTVGMILKNFGAMSKQFTHLGVLNETAYPLSFVPGTNDPQTGFPLVPTANANASYQTNNKLYVVSNGFGYMDNIALFDNLFIQTEGGASATRGTISVMVW